MTHKAWAGIARFFYAFKSRTRSALPRTEHSIETRMGQSGGQLEDWWSKLQKGFEQLTPSGKLVALLKQKMTSKSLTWAWVGCERRMLAEPRTFLIEATKTPTASLLSGKLKSLR